MKSMKHESISSSKALVAFVLFLLVQCAGCFQQPVVPSTRSYRTVHSRHFKDVSSRKTPSSTRDTSLQALPSILTAVGSPVGAVAVLAGVILVHEAGHYLAARSLGIKVEEFSVGIGPKLFGIEKWGNEFNLRGLPLGGYVRFPENYNSALVNEMQEEAMNRQIQTPKEEENTAMSNLMNVLTLGRLERKRKEEEARAQQEKEEASNKNWWSNVFGTKKEEPIPEPVPPAKLEIEYYDDPDLLQNRPWPQRALVLSGGVIFNILLAFLIFFGEVQTNGLPKPVFDQGAVVSSIPREQSASKGVLQRGDVIVGVNGSPLTVVQSPNAVAAQQGITDFITKIRATPEGESLQLSVLRDNKSPVDVVVQPKRTMDELGTLGPQSIGVLLRPNLIKMESIRSESLPQAVSLAASSVTDLTQQTANGLLAFFSQLASGKGAPPGQSVSGPIGLIRTGTSVVSTNDLAAILFFAASISVNLAVVNALPLPALDGGQMLFVISEALTGRKVDQRVQEGITSVALIFLLLLSFGTTIGDVESFFR